MANNLLPARTGELVRAYILGERHQMSKMSVMGTIAVERTFDAIVLLLFLVSVAAFVGLSQALAVIVAVVAPISLLLLGVFLLVASSQERADRCISWLLRVLPERFRDRARSWVTPFVEGLQALRSARVVAVVLAATVVAWALEATMYFMVGVSFNVGEAFPIFLLVAAAANLAITLPSTSGGIGPFEFFAREALVLVGVGSALATDYAIALHGLLLLPVIVVGLYFLWMIHLSLGQLLRRPAQDEQPAPAAVEPQS